MGFDRGSLRVGDTSSRWVDDDEGLPTLVG